MDTISIIINLDTRSGIEAYSSTQGTMSEGTRNYDFFTDGIENKIRLFKDYNTEVILFIDVHECNSELFSYLNQKVKEKVISKLILSNHNETFEGSYCPQWNDLNYINALFMAKGKYIVHFDGDSAIFGRDSSFIEEWFRLLEEGKYDYISYPSLWSPSPDIDSNWDYRWVSTRFYMCKRETLDFTEIRKCLFSSDYMYEKYGKKYKCCPWLEHVLGIATTTKEGVFYPPMDYNKYLIFCWSKYYKGILNKLNNASFDKVIKYISSYCGGISYPCDVMAIEIPGEIE